jgi:predicted AAA+ superfamily ATPase
MLQRRLTSLVLARLNQFPAVALLGPRQVGKTTLARLLPAIAGELAPVDYLDLENPAHLAKLGEPGAYPRGRHNRLTIIDEVQRLPGLFQVLRGIIDERILPGASTAQFLLLGSASIDLLRQSSETLAGRVAYLELEPLDVLEVEPQFDQRLWLRGGFPRSFLAESDAQSVTWRESFIATYLERDIPQLGPRIPAETLRRFWTMLAHSQGSLLNAAQLASGLGVDGKTVAKYLDLMVDLLLVRRLPSYHANVGKRLVKSPKTYVRDSGLVHTLLRLDDLDQLLGHPIAGPSWEGHVVENLSRAAPMRSRAYFYRTAAGAEIDLVLELPGDKRWAVEIKRSSAPKLEVGFRRALEDLQPERAFIAYSGDERYPKADGVEVIGVRALAAQLADLERA